MLFPIKAIAQLSPGGLAQPHAHLEGLSNCTQCHELGEKVSDQKCLNCHTEIQNLIDQNRGFHASNQVRGKDCALCHSDHHGQKFDMARFDEDNFDHGLTGYDLTGAHTRIDCRQCHIPDFIDDRELKKREETFLGLGTDCIGCHEDYHQNTLGPKCADCHTTKTFTPAEKFDHKETKYPLTGKHKEVDCRECHAVVTRNGKEFQNFANVPFVDCNACHEDVHENNLGTNCKQCHSEESFVNRRTLRRFRHNQTAFPLKGQHKAADCFACHTPDFTPSTVFQNILGTTPDDCMACHEDVHEGRFGTSCIDCHNEESWRAAVDLDHFNHDLTDFPLAGKHEVVDCRQCHISESLTDPMPHTSCMDCHDDYHEGEFASRGSPDCAECHTVEGFTPSLFTFENHAESSFLLEGAHLATPCFACHIKEGKWQFRGIGQRCVDCHDDVHKGEIATEYYPNQTCEKCHSTGRWKDENYFDHDQTAFVLEGGHIRADCAACHLRDEEKPYGHFVGLSQECIACHENVHGSQFEIAGLTDCRRCHGFEGWTADFFDHNQTAFPLEGKHAEVACGQCHEATEVDGEMRVEYKMVSFECIDCHQ